jgi:hypothetical protein
MGDYESRMHPELQRMHCQLSRHAGPEAARSVLASLHGRLRRLPGGRKLRRTMTPIAARQLTYRDDAGHERTFSVQLSQPRNDDGFWACDYEIGAPAHFAATAYGEDSLQALVMALHAVQAHLNAPDLRGRVRWLDAPVTTIIDLP